MNIPGAGLLKQVERAGNQVRVPLTRGLGLSDLAKKTFAQMGADHIGAYAGSLTYSFVFALFPFLAFLVSLVGILDGAGVIDARQLIDEMLRSSGAALPQAAGDLIRELTDRFSRPANDADPSNDPRFGLAAVVSLLVALWGVSGAFRSVMDALNVMYGVVDTRPFWKKYLVSILLALGATLLLLTAVVLVVFGTTISGAIANATPLGSTFEWAWNILQWPVLLGFVLLAFALVYYFAPDVEQKFKFLTPGSILAVLLWLVFSLLFSLYVNNFGSYNKTYGTLAGVAILMLYLYYASYILLMGAEINQIVEEHASEGKDTGERTLNEDKSQQTARR